MFCRDKNISRDKHKFVATKLVKTNIWRDKHNFGTTKVLSRQTHVCLDETRLLSRQNYASIIFVATKHLSQQKWYLWQLPPMIDFVPTCIALVCHSWYRQCFAVLPIPRLLFRYPFHPRVTAVARKRPRSFCQKCRWQVTAKTRVHLTYVALHEVTRCMVVWCTQNAPRWQQFMSHQPCQHCK